MTNGKFDALFGGKPRKPEELLTQREMDLAASIQAVTEEIVLRLTRALAAKTGQKNLCLAGGVALNCVANGKVLRDGKFDADLDPAGGGRCGRGGRRGARDLLSGDRRGAPERRQATPCAAHILGRPTRDEDIAARLKAVGARFEVLERGSRWYRRPREHWRTDQAVGWFQGRMEFGPRALGARSILGDARSPTMQKMLNLKVKYRESFRPFAPAVLREHVADWFELDRDSPYMLLVAGVRPERRRAMTEDEKKLWGIDQLNVVRSDIPAVTHVDYSARIQTVHADTNPRFHRLLAAFQRAYRLSGAGQHELQCARRTDCLHAGRCLPLLHGHRHRGAGDRQLPAAQGRSGPGAETELRAQVRAGLD